MSVPRGLYGPDRDGMGDPERPTVPERVTRSQERITTEAGRASTRSPLLDKLRRVALRITAPTRGLGE